MSIGSEPVETTTYTWNAKNQLTQVTYPDAGFSLYAYHPDSPLRRLHVKKDGAATAFLWDPQTQNNLEDIEVGSGATRATHQHGTGMDQLVGTEGPAGTRGYVTDALGSVRVVQDPIGNVTGRYGYTAYGEPRGEQESEGNRFRFTGREWEPESGLNFTRNRYYRPSCGCWVSADPIGFDGGMNLWGYVNENPTTLSDPLGLRAATMAAEGCFTLAVTAAERATIVAALKAAGAVVFAPEVLVTGGVLITIIYCMHSQSGSDPDRLADCYAECQSNYDRDVDQCKNSKCKDKFDESRRLICLTLVASKLGSCKVECLAESLTHH